MFLEETEWEELKYRVITNDVSDYITLLVRIAHIICNPPLDHDHGYFHTSNYVTSQIHPPLSHLTMNFPHTYLK